MSKAIKFDLVICLLTIETCGFGFKSLYHHHMQSEKTLSHFLKNPAEAQSLRGFAVFRCCLRPKAPT